jgi:hypothetical protein
MGEESTVTCFQVQHGERYDVALVTGGVSPGTVCSHAEIIDNRNQLRMLRDGCPRATPINCLNQRAQIPSIRYVKKSHRPHASISRGCTPHSSISRGCTPHFPISQRCTQSITAVAEAESIVLLRQAYSLGILDIQTFFRDWPRVETKILILTDCLTRQAFSIHQPDRIPNSTAGCVLEPPMALLTS